LNLNNISLLYFSTYTGFNLSGAGLATANHIAPLYWNALGEVKRCRELTGGKQGHYGIGVEHHPN